MLNLFDRNGSDIVPINNRKQQPDNAGGELNQTKLAEHSKKLSELIENNNKAETLLQKLDEKQKTQDAIVYMFVVITAVTLMGVFSTLVGLVMDHSSRTIAPTTQIFYINGASTSTPVNDNM